MEIILCPSLNRALGFCFVLLFFSGVDVSKGTKIVFTLQTYNCEQ